MCYFATFAGISYFVDGDGLGRSVIAGGAATACLLVVLAIVAMVRRRIHAG